MVEIILSLFQSLLPERGGGGVNQKNYSQKGFAALGRTADVRPPLKTDGESDNIKNYIYIYIYIHPQKALSAGLWPMHAPEAGTKRIGTKADMLPCVCVFLCLFIYLRDQLSASVALIGGCELCDSSKSHVLSARSATMPGTHARPETYYVCTYT
jgi:hypothetical protein